MGKTVSIVYNGKTVEVSEEDAKILQGAGVPVASQEEGTAKAVSSLNQERYSGLRQGVGAAVEGALDTVTGGLYGAAASYGDPDYEGAARAQARPGARLVGDVAGLLLPTGLPGAAAKAGKGIKAATGSAFAGRVVEGALLGAGGQVTASHLSADPLSVEGVVEGIGVSALLNAGFGAAADRLLGVVGKSGGAISKTASAADGPFGQSLEAEAVTTRGATPRADAARAAENAARARQRVSDVGDAESLAAAKQMLDESPAYANVKAAYESTQKAAREFNAGITRETKAYEAATTGKKLTGHLEDLEKQQQETRAALQKEARASEEAALREGDLPLGETPGDVIPEAANDTAGDFSTPQKRLTQLTRDINKVRKDIKAGFTDHAADTLRGHFPEIPRLPGDLKTVGPDLPKTLYELGKSRAETVAEIAGHADDLTKAELDKLAAEVGYDAGETAHETLATLNRRVREDYVLPSSRVASRLGPAEEAAAKAKWEEASAAVDAQRRGQTVLDETGELSTTGGGYQEWSADAVSRGAEAAKKDASILDKPIQWAKNGLRGAAGRAADMGGWKGSVLRSIAGGAAGYAISGTEGVVSGAALFNGKMGVRAKIGEALSMFGRPVGAVLSKLGPVTAAMYSRFPSGEHDSEKDLSKAVVNRINEVHTAAASAPDAAFNAMRGFMGDPGDVAFKLGQKMVGDVKYLSDTAPKDPGIDVTASGSNWVPSFMKSDEWAHRYEAVTNPMGYVARVLQGEGSPAGVEALAARWGALLQETCTAAAEKDWSDLSLEESRGLSMLFQQPITGLQHPDVVMMIQGNYLPKPETAGPTAGGKPGFGSNPTGRPPAVSSSIAGSSVSGLTQ